MRFATAAVLLLALAVPQARADDAPAQDDPIPALESAWRRAPTDVTSGVALLDALRAAGRTSTARRLVREAHAAQPDDGRIAFLQAYARADERGLRLMREALAADLGHPEDKRSLISAAIALMQGEVAAGHGKEAAAAATRLTALRGVGADWCWLGWVQHALLSDAAAASSSYEKGLRVDERSLCARTALIRLRLAEKRLDDARTLALRGVALHPDRADAHFAEGLVHATAGRTKQALASFGRARRLAAGNASMLTALASAYAEAKKPQEAGELYTAALAVDPEHGGALGGAGLLALEAGRNEEAAALLERARRARPKDARIAFLQGTALQRLGRDSSAVTAFRRAYDLEPERPEYLQALALAYLEKGSLAPATRMFKRAIKQSPDDADLYRQLGITWMRRRSYPQARDAFLAAAARAPKDPRPHYYLAILYGDKMGKGKEALVALENYSDRGGKDPRMLRWRDELRAALGR